MPDDVQVYLLSQPGWSVVDTKDLVEDDQNLWEQHHRGLCPGIGIVDLDGRGETAYALALLNHANGQVTEKVVVIRNQGGSVAELLVPPMNIMFTNVASPLLESGTWNLSGQDIR